MKFGAAIPVLNEFRFLPAVLGQLLKICDRVVVLRGTKSLSGAPVDLASMPVLDERVEVHTGNWDSEHETRNTGMELLADCDYVFTVDSDEIFQTQALRLLRNSAVMGNGRYTALACRMWTYWKTTRYRIDPPETIAPPVLVHRSGRFAKLRQLDAHTMVLVGDRPLMHHLSYVRTDEALKEKLRLFGHASEIVPGWYEGVWKRWDENHDLEDLHPTHPSAYKRAVAVHDRGLEEVLFTYGVQ